MADALAIYGAVVSTSVAVWNGWRWWQDRRPRIRVAPVRNEVRGPVVIYGDGPAVGGFATVAVSVANTGAQTITVESARIELLAVPAAARFVTLEPDDGEPVIAPGTRRVFSVTESQLDDSRAELALHIELADGTGFRSQPFGLDWNRASGPPRPKMRRVRGR